MDVSLFAALEGLSPWWWVAFGITLGAIEMATMSFFLIWPGIAAVVMAALLWAVPAMPGEVQIAVFAALSVVLTYLFRARFLASTADIAPNGLNERSNRMIGMQGKVLSFENGEGKVEIEGIPWVAKWESGASAVGGSVTVSQTRGTVLMVKA